MPNYCINNLFIAQDEDDPPFDPSYGDNPFSFESVLPVPDALVGISTGSIRLSDGTIVSNWRDGPDGKPIPVDDEALFKAHGASNALDWQRRNWDTKWDACDPVRTREGWSFSTAWGPPIPVILAWSIKYPHLTFELTYYECGAAVCGIFVFRHGDILSSVIGGYRGCRGG